MTEAKPCCPQGTPHPGACLSEPGPAQSIPALIVKKYPNPVHLEGSPLSAEGLQRRARPTSGLQTNPGQSPRPRRAGQVHIVWSELSPVFRS